MKTKEVAQGRLPQLQFPQESASTLKGQPKGPIPKDWTEAGTASFSSAWPLSYFSNGTQKTAKSNFENMTPRFPIGEVGVLHGLPM